jgi:hypothetical protein
MAEDLHQKIRETVSASHPFMCNGCEFDCSCKTCSGMADAIIAVLDMHPEHPSLKGVCFTCSSHYPCRQVRAIADCLDITVEAVHGD